MLSGIIRESISKADTKALRKNGYLIANIYGKGKENIHCAFKRNDFIREVKNKTDLIFEVEVGTQKYPVVIQEYQKDPITSEIIHVDLMLAQKGVEAKYSVKVRIEGVAKGLKNKGVLMISKKRIKVKATPENLPKDYEINVTKPTDIKAMMKNLKNFADEKNSSIEKKAINRTVEMVK